jgi:DNA (cytosine-5)-methyltransferase 1
MRTQTAIEDAGVRRPARGAFLEFFCGGGMARVGLGPRWRCLFANDFDPRKARAYAANFGTERLAVKDVAAVTTEEIAERADLAWASFPCQDLSLAGAGFGLDGRRSGAFWSYWRLMQALCKAGRGPRLIVLENVCGLLTSSGGADFAALLRAVLDGGYAAGAVVIDAVDFTPQSRPRLFLLAVARDVAIPSGLVEETPPSWGVSAALVAARDRLAPDLRARFLWWRLPPPPRRNAALADLVEETPAGVTWASAEAVERLLSLMAPNHRQRVAAAVASGRRQVGALYRRTRPVPGGGKAQRAEVRFDGLAGCLRTPAGGSSRQSLLIVENGRARARLLSPREAARLMGLPESYILPDSYNETYHLLGDGVVAAVVRHLADHWMAPLLGAGA